jgi:hypothetical protein
MMHRPGVISFLGLATLSLTALAQPGAPLKPISPVVPKVSVPVTPSALRQKGPIYKDFVKLPPPRLAFGKPFANVPIVSITGIDGAAYGIPYGGQATLRGSFGDAQAGRQLVLDRGGTPIAGRPAVVARTLLRVSSWTKSSITFVAPTAAELGVAPGYSSTPSVRGTISILSAPAPQTGFGGSGGPTYGSLLAGVPDVQIGHQMVDADGDGHNSVASGGDDCDDLDPNRYPGNTEVPDDHGHDEDCDPTTYGCIDRDNDHFCAVGPYNTDATGRQNTGDDCDDNITAVHPGQIEVCNGRDDDCNGFVDEGVYDCHTCTRDCAPH